MINRLGHGGKADLAGLPALLRDASARHSRPRRRGRPGGPDLRAGAAVRRRHPGAGYTVANDVVLNQVIVDFGDQARTSAVIAAVQDEGTCWCGPTIWQGRAAIRVSVSACNTTEQDIDRSVAAVIARAARSRP